MSIPYNLLQSIVQSAPAQTILNNADYGQHMATAGGPATSIGDGTNLFNNQNWSVDPSAQPPTTPQSNPMRGPAIPIESGFPGQTTYMQGGNVFTKTDNPNLVTNQATPNFNFNPGPQAGAGKTTSLMGPDPTSIPALMAAKEAADKGVAAASQGLSGLGGPPANVSAQQLIGGKNTRRDLITGLLPLAVSLLFGKKGQEFAGGFIPGWLQGKGQQAQLQNQNQQQAYEAKYRSAATQLQSAQQQAQYADQNLQIAAQAHKYEQMYGPGSAKYLQQTANKLQDQVIHGGPEERVTAAGKLSEMYGSTGIGVNYSPEDIKNLYLLKPGEKYQQAGVALRGAMTDLDTKKAKAVDLANQLNIDLNPIKVNAGHIKNTKDLAEINKINAQTADIPKRTAYLADYYAKSGFLKGAQAEEAAINTALAPTIAQSKIDDMYSKIADNENKTDIELAKIKAGDRKIAADKIMGGIKEWEGQIKNFEDLKAKVKVPEDEKPGDDDTPNLDKISYYNNRINALRKYVDGLHAKSDAILQGMGYDPATGKELSTGQQIIQKHVAAKHPVNTPAGTPKVGDIVQVPGHTGNWQVGSDGQLHRVK